MTNPTTPETTEQQLLRLEQKIGHQRHEIENRLIEIGNLLGFKRNMEMNVAHWCPAEFKRRPLGGIAWMAERIATLQAELQSALHDKALLEHVMNHMMIVKSVGPNTTRIWDTREAIAEDKREFEEAQENEKP
jgi:hypothetical protein